MLLQTGYFPLPLLQYHLCVNKHSMCSPFKGNMDRHHYETFEKFGNETFLLHLDNGRA